MRSWIHLLTYLLFITTDSVRIQNCPTGSLEAVENTADFSLTCVEYTAAAAWSFKQPGSISSLIGTCASACNTDPGYSPYFTLTPLSVSSSRLDLTSNTTTLGYPQFVYNCETASCLVNIVVHAELSTPIIALTTPGTGSGWTVRGSVVITRVFSGAGHYPCDWSVRKDSGAYTAIVNKNVTIDPPVSDTSVRTGHCDFPATPLSYAPGTYTYSVTVSPGHSTKTDSSVVVDTPATPTVSCNPATGQVSEGAKLNCTCSSDVGRPQGRLRGFVVNTNNVITDVKEGQYGDVTLPMTFTVNRTDRKLRCDVEWIRNITGTDFLLDITYPPSSPTITRSDGNTRPPLELDSVSLTCSVTSPGNPPAEVTWPSEGSNVKVNPLLLVSLGKGDHQRSVTCQASNAFTQDKGLQLTESFVLHVYYGPYITIRHASDNSCNMTSDGTTCHVIEGQRVHLQCDIDSSPAPGSCTWRVLPGSNVDHDLDLGPDLDIVSANRTHSGVYQVQVETTRPDPSDGRLPLRAQRNLTVLVAYPPTGTTMVANSDVSLTLNESEAVTFVCQSRGRPAPDLALLQRGAQLARQDGGNWSEEGNHLSYSAAARCHNTGTVTCRADNWVGSSQESSVRLYVNCKPRDSTTAEPEETPEVNFVNKPISVSFRLEAFPLPDVFRFRYLGNIQNLSSSLPVPDSIVLSASCRNTFADYAVLCNVTVESVQDSSAEGFYTFAVANAFGEDRFTFLVRKNDSGDQSSVTVAIAVAVGVTLAVVLIIVVVVIIVMWRRRWVLPCASDDAQGQNNEGSRQPKQQSRRSTREDPPADLETSDAYELVEETSPRHTAEHQPSTVYSSLQTSDIGVPSVYSDISPYRSAGAGVDQQVSEPVYENNEDAGNRPVYVNLPNL